MRALRSPAALFVAFALVIAQFFALAVADALPPEIASGLQWLSSQIQSDGALTGEEASVATREQVRYEAHETTSLLGQASETLRNWLGLDAAEDTEFMARRALQLAVAERPDAALLAKLSARQNTDGGFASVAGEGSQTLDTAFALLAYKKTNGLSGTQVQAALSYLLRNKRADGGWGPGSSKVYDTATVLMAANAWSSAYSVGQIVSPAKDWLLSQRSAGGHYETVLENSIALLALATQTNQPDILNPMVNAIKAAQAADGSWGQDPYQTALALRALWFVGKAPAVPVTGEISGTVLDASSSQALAGATVQVLENTSVAGTTDAAGAFALSGLSEARYTLRISKLGYESRDMSVDVVNGKQTAVGSVLLRKQSLTASVSGVVKTSGGSVIPDAIVTVGTQSVMTNASGQYALSGISPGQASITVIKTGYNQASASVDFQAGKTYVFSPALYSGSAPTSATMRGKVVDAASGLAVPGARVTVGSVSATSAADGKFELTGLTAGSFSATITATGYQNYSASGALVNGINDAGTLSMAKAPTTSTLQGKVLDAVTGLPVAGATVTVVGPNLSASTDAAGAYQINGVALLSFPLSAGADGYQVRTYNVSLERAGVAQIDIQLAQVQASKLSIEALKVSKTQYNPGDEFELAFDLLNSGAQSLDTLVDAQIINEQGQVSFEMFANAKGLGENPPNLPVSVVSGAAKEFELEQFLVHQPAGNYTAIVRAKDTSGLVLAEKSVGFSVLEKPMLAGGVALTPPLVQAGTNTPVQIKAQISNRGNAPMSAGNLKLKATLVNRDTSSIGRTQTGLSTLVSGGLLSNATAMARDASGTLFVANRSDGRILRVDASGATSIYFTIPSSKAPNVKDLAIDAAGNFWVANANNKVWKITPNLELSEIALTQISSLLALDVTTAGDLYLTGTGGPSAEARLIKRTAEGVESVLWRNGLSSPMGVTRSLNGDFIIANNGDGSLVKIDKTTKAVSVVTTGLDRPLGVTTGPDGNYYVTTAASSTAVMKVLSTTGDKSVYASGVSALADLKFDANGTLFVASQNDNSIYKVPAGGGSFQLFAKGISNRPASVGFDANGSLYLANMADGGSLSALDTDGTVRVLGTSLGTVQGMAVIAPSDVLVVNSSGGSINRVTSGGKQVFASGLSSPYGVSVDGSDVYVSERGVARISVFDLASGARTRTLEPVLGTPRGTRAGADGSIYVYNTDAGGYISKFSGGVGSVFYKGSISEFAPDPTTGGLVAVRNSDVLLISPAGVATKLVTLPFTPYGVGVLADGRLVVGAYSAKKAVLIDRSTGAQTDLAVLSGNPSKVTTDIAGRVFALLNNDKILRIDDNGTQTSLYDGTEYVYDISPGLGDAFPFWTNYAKLYSLNGLTGSVSVVKSSGFAIYGSGGVAFVDGAIHVSDAGSYSLSTYNSAFVLSSRIQGFTGLSDIVVQGGVLTFTDTADRLLRWTPGTSAYPTLLATGFAARSLSLRNGQVYGVSSSVLRRWNGSAVQTLLTLEGSNDLYGLAQAPDGRWYLADNARSRVHVVNSSESAVDRVYAGLVKPYGLVFDAQGRLLVANNSSNTILRYNSTDAGALPEAFANLSSPRFLTIDSAGALYASAASNIYKLSATGAPSIVGPSLAAQGVTLDANDAVVGLTSSSTAVRYVANDWEVMASGLSTPSRVKVAANGDVYVANQGNGTVVAYAGDTLVSKASRLPAPFALALTDAGGFVVGGDSGSLFAVDMAGAVQDYNVDGLIGTSTRLLGLVSQSSSELYAQSGTAVYKLQISEPVAPPDVGTVVYEASRPLGGLGTSDDPLNVDFGSWLPPYAGDFHFEITYEGVDGVAQNFLHVGSYAQGALTVNVAEVPAGTQRVPLTLKLTGADFTTVSRVETSMVRRLIANEQPYGMTGDKSGAIWYTTGSALKKTPPGGAAVTVVSGITPAYGLAVDPEENFYLPVRNAQSKYDLMRVTRDGASEVIAALNVTSANGVGVNSRGDIFVGSAGRLLRVDAITRAVTTFTTVGVPSPLGVAIDGKDNIYIQNTNNLVSMIRPDATVQVIYDKADGVDHPQFEGDGYPTITADCADNFYITASQWKKINQSGEEHILAQVSPRTGVATALFDGLQIDSVLSDIDYLAYDRFSNRVLMWNHYDRGGPAIWQVPVTCGAIGVEAHVLTKPGQSISGFDRAPSATIPLADGRTEYVWSLRDVTADGLNIGFDTVLKDLTLGESRPAVDSGFITFKNSFAPEDVKVALDVPKVQVANLINLGVGIDKAQYNAAETVNAEVSLNNTQVRDIGGELVVQIRDASGNLVAELRREGVILPAGSTQLVGLGFAVGSTVPGDYVVYAELRENSLLAAHSQVPFKILQGELATSAKSTLSIDKQIYSAFDTVRITSRAFNTSPNAVLENLSLRVKVFDPANAVLSDKTYDLPQLVSGAFKEFPSTYGLKSATAGAYRVEQTYADGMGTVIDTHVAAFTVTSTAQTGAGLRGGIVTTPKEVPSGEALAFSWNVENLGNEAIDPLNLKVRIVDPAADVVLSEVPYALTLGKGASSTASGSWTANVAAGARLVAVLSHEVGGKSVTLAQDVVSVIAQPVKFDVQQQAQAGTGGQARVLVLYDCEPDMGWDLLSWLRLYYTHSCYKDRKQYIDAYLTSLNVPHYITYDRTAFRRELRSGAYNTIWMLGALPDCGTHLLNEVREAVNRGATLLVDGGTTAYENHALYRLAGARYGGHIWLSTKTMDVTGSSYTGTRLSTVGLPLRLSVSGGTVQASYANNVCYKVDYDGDDDSKHPYGTPYPAVISNGYGRGKAVAMAFDLINALRNGGADAANWKRFVNETVGYLTPADEARALVPGEFTVLGAQLANQGSAADVQARMSLPTGASVVGTTPTATLEPGNKVLWKLNVAAGVTQPLQLTMRAPLTAGSYSVATDIAVVRNSVVQPYGSYSQSFTVMDNLTPAKAALTRLKSLNVSLLEALTLLDAKVNLDYGISLYQQGRYHEAVEELGEAANAVRQLSADLRAERLAIDRLIQEAQYRWYLVQPK